MSKEKYQPCERCGSTIDEYLFEYTDLSKIGVPGEKVVVEHLCFVCVSDRKKMEILKKQYS